MENGDEVTIVSGGFNLVIGLRLKDTKFNAHQIFLYFPIFLTAVYLDWGHTTSSSY